MRVLSPDACGATWDINASTNAQSVMGPECSNDHKGREVCHISGLQADLICNIYSHCQKGCHVQIYINT